MRLHPFTTDGELIRRIIATRCAADTVRIVRKGA
jgi:hypothetical protein